MTTSARLPIGIFDSGIGGLTVVKQVHSLLPHEDLIYLGDTARVPYGTKSPQTVIRFATEDARFMVQQNVKAIVVACNTASAWALPTLEKTYSVPIFGVINPGAQAAVRASRNHRIGVIGTTATVRSQAYLKAIHSHDPEAQVYHQACPLLVPLVEEGWIGHSVTRAVIHEYLQALLKKHIDTLVLGCTHYPLLKAVIRKVSGSEVKLIDSAECCARDVEDHLGRRGLLNPQRKRGRIQPFVTDEAEHFVQLSGRFLSVPMERAWKVSLVAG
jgi:glutamate racemase